jgi:ectoine hydroxylase-related dioxygenase (phytanoyl-CoA dioxygenase family)
MGHPLGEFLRFILWQDPVFEEALLRPVSLGLVSWLVGPSCLCNGMVKGPGDNFQPLHTDEGSKVFPVHPVDPQTANINYFLSDYTKDAGAIAFIPGSHRWRREPSRTEAREYLEKLVPIEAPAGSMVIWGDHTWHGSFPRTEPGLRITLLFTFARHHLQTQEPYRDTCARRRRSTVTRFGSPS